jgi:hypothetical protein
MLRTFTQRKLMFVPVKRYCETGVFGEFKVLLSQREDGLILHHNSMELFG